jgi:hypothetical protein
MSSAGFFSIAFGVGAILYSGFNIVRALLSTRWPSVSGKIAMTRLVYHAGDDTGDRSYVAYSYEVNGQPYRNDRVRFGPINAPRSIVPGVDPAPNNPVAAAALAERWPDGSQVRVFYNPSRPADSVLYQNVDWSVWAVLTAGLIFLYAGVRS